jgi:RES domain-containing protein
VILHRCFAWNPAARDNGPDGPLWFPRMFQGEGRHDNPDAYGCLYLADRAVSCVVEQLAAFRGQRLIGSLLRRRGLPLALAQIELEDRAMVIDLDDPVVLRRERLRPSRVATRDRSVTQPQALALYRAHPDVAGLRWWSTWEALWANITVFDRASPSLRLAGVRELTLEDPAVLEAAEFFGLRVM